MPTGLTLGNLDFKMQTNNAYNVSHNSKNKKIINIAIFCCNDF